MGCHRAEKVMPMLKRWTVLPAIHIMKPIIMRFLNGACATSHAFCSHQESTRGSGSRPRKTLRYAYRPSRQVAPSAARICWANHSRSREDRSGLTCAFHAVSESFRWRAPAASSCGAAEPCEFRHPVPKRAGNRWGQ